MELWEGAILAVGGIALVCYMAKKNTVVQTSLANAPGTGVSNASNLTNITNTAGGTPTTYGEPLEPPQPPLTSRSIVPTAPDNTWGGRPPIMQAPNTGVRVATPGAGVLSPGFMPPRGTLARPIDIHL